MKRNKTSDIDIDKTIKDLIAKRVEDAQAAGDAAEEQQQEQEENIKKPPAH